MRQIGRQIMRENVTYLKHGDESSFGIASHVTEAVQEIITGVTDRGDSALFEYTERFDGVTRDRLAVSDAEIEEAHHELTTSERDAIDQTIANVRSFHEEQFQHFQEFEREFRPGMHLGQRIVPIQRVGTYIPGGRHPLVATPAMTIVPASIVGVDTIVACAPPQSDGTIEPAQLYAMDQAGADDIYCVGGAQAIAAMAFGTESIPSVSKITGPGNQYTTEAKRQVYGHVGIDLMAGPSEVLILTDETADPALAATDLLAQAEHDPNSRPILVATDEDIARETIAQVNQQLPRLDTEDVARECWQQNGEVVLTDDLETAVAVVNDYAMEHVQLLIDEPRSVVDDLYNYGCLFIGEHSPVVFGDKSAGTNHSLPTLEAATYTGGISTATYCKILTHLEMTADGADQLVEQTVQICELEGTHAHRLSAEARRL